MQRKVEQFWNYSHRPSDPAHLAEPLLSGPVALDRARLEAEPEGLREYP
jgi:hypothetical protein